MRIWFDCNTAKEALLFPKIIHRIERRGYDYLLTCRDYGVTASLLSTFDLEYKVIGKHGGGTLQGKLLASADRTKLLAEYIINLNDEKTPGFAVYLNSPEAARVAFGLAIPSACLNDTPHAKATIKLVIPFSNYIILPEFIPVQPYTALAPRDNIQKYEGIDAVEIFRDFKPDEEVLSGLNLDPSQRIVLFRPEEAFASYYPSNSDNPLPIGGKVLEKIISHYPNVQVVVIPRYLEQRRAIEAQFPRENFIIPKEAVDTRSLEAFSDLVITGGSTIAEEAAVQGTPAISYFPNPLYRWKWLKRKQFPGSQIRDIQEAIDKTLQILKNPEEYKKETSHILKKLQAPSDILVKILEEEFRETP